MLQAIFGAITGIYEAIANIFSFIGSFIDNVVAAVIAFISYSDYAKGLLNIFPAIHVITGTLAVGLSIGLVLKVIGR